MIVRVFPASECYKNEVDKVHGFSQMTDYNVQFIDNNGNYLVKVTWKTPLGKCA